MALTDILGGSQEPLPTLTPESIKRKRLLAEAMLKQGMDFSPIASPWQGAARLANALVGGLEDRRLDRQEREGQASANKSIADILSREYGGGSDAAAAAPAAAASPTPSRALPAFASDVTGGINQATAKYGLDPSYLPTTAAIESNGNPSAANPNSSARGLFQFMPGTARQYGLTNPNDPGAAADAAARLALDNKKALVAALGRDPTPAELYLAHQQGAGGAAKLLANPDAPASAIVGEQAVRLNGGSPGMTAGEFAQKWLGKFNSRAGTQVASADPGFVPSPAYAPPQQAMQMPPGMGSPAPREAAQPQQPAAQPGPLPAMAGGQQAMQMPPQAAQAQAIPQQIAQAAAHPQVQAAAQQAAQTPQGQQMVQQARGAPIGAIIQALSNPYMSDGQKSLLLMIAKEKMDPVRNTVDLGGSVAVMDKQGNILRQIPKQRDALSDEKARLDIEAQRKSLNMPNGEVLKDGEGNPIGFFDKQSMQFKPLAGLPDPQNKKTNDQRDYEVARAQGFPGSFMDYQVKLKQEGAQKQYPAPSPGYRFTYDGKGQVVGQEIIPGSPQAKAEDQKTKGEKESANLVVDALDRIETRMKDANLPTTGGWGAITSRIPNTNSHDIANLVQTVKANTSFQALNAMRAASPTGGALGAVSDAEQKLLAASVASLEQSQTEKQFRENLAIVRRHFNYIINGTDGQKAGKQNIGGYTIERVN